MQGHSNGTIDPRQRVVGSQALQVRDELEAARVRARLGREQQAEPNRSADDEYVRQSFRRSWSPEVRRLRRRPAARSPIGRTPDAESAKQARQHFIDATLLVRDGRPYGYAA